MKTKSLIQTILLVTLFLIPITAFSGEWGPMTSGTTEHLYGVWGNSATDVFAVGNYGTILHYTSGTWSKMTSGNTTDTLNDVWGSSPTDVFAVGASGTILHYTSGTWSKMSSGTTQTLRGVWGNSGTNVFAVGGGVSDCVIVRYNGTNWSPMTIPTDAKYLSDVWGTTSGTDVFAVGGSGIIVHYNGTSWHTDINIGYGLLGVWGSSATDVFVSAYYQGHILHYNGTSWSSMSSGTTKSLPDVWGSSGNDVFVVGYTGTILHYTSGTWSTMTSGTTNNLNGVWGSSDSNVFAVGDSGKILKYTAYSISGTVTGDVQADVTITLTGSGTGSTTTDASGNYSFRGLSNGSYTVTPSKAGYTFTPTNRPVTISGADVTGQNFTATAYYSISGTVTLSGSGLSGVTMTLTGSGTGSTTTNVSGYYILDYVRNGSYTVTPSKSGYTFTPSSLQVSISGASVSGKNFTAIAAGTYSISGTVTLSGSGLSGVTMALTGSGKGSMPTDSSGNYSFTNLSNGIYTVTPSKGGYAFTPSSLLVTISGANQTGKNFTATAVTGEWGWGIMNSGTTEYLTGIWGSSETDIFAVGYNGKILHYNGTNWSFQDSGTINYLYGVWGSSATNVFAVGDSSTIVHYNGTNWHPETGIPTGYLHGVWGNTASDVFAVGAGIYYWGIILHYNGATWSTNQPSASLSEFYGVWGNSGTNVFAVGIDYDYGTGIIFRYNGTSWSPMTIPTGTNYLYGVWGSSATDVFAVGDEGTILHYDGDVWSPMTSGIPSYYTLSGIWGSSAGDVYAVGEGGTILHYNGTSWSSMTTDSYESLYGIWGSSASDIFAVGGDGTILHTTYLYSLSGTVTGDTQAGVNVCLSGCGVTKCTTTDASGNYSFTRLSNCTYTITPSKTNYTFTPTSTPVTVSGADVTGINFTATENTYTISGTVAGEIQADVTMTLAGSVSPTTTTDTSGNYAFRGLKIGSYTITPSGTGYYFTPTNKKVTINLTDMPNQNFTSAAYHSISGTVTGDVQAGVTMTLTGSVQTTTTDASGDYIFTDLKKGAYTVTPSRTGYSFTPTSSKVTISGADVSDVDFVATSLPIYSISGTVSGDTQAGVTITILYHSISGDTTTNTTTNTSGYYEFRGLRNGTYTVTPSKTGYTFSPTNTKVQIHEYNATGVNFIASVVGTYSISGNVTCGAGITMTLTGTSSGSTTTDVSGNYSFTGLKKGTYTVTPSKSGYSFAPPSSTVIISEASVAGVNFTCTPPTFSISGTVSGDTKAGVTMSLFGCVSATTITDASGNYSFRGLSNCTYLVMPSKTNYTFTPSSMSVTISGANVTGINFTATENTYSISGTVTGDTKADVTMTLSGSVSATTITDASGNYTFRGLINGIYNVAPRKTNYAFTPTSMSVTINGANVTGVNFTATIAHTFSISGTVTGDVQAGVTIAIFGSISANTTTDTSGNYRFTGISNGTYLVMPTKTGYTFSPASTPVIISGTDVAGVNFVATVVATYSISGTVTDRDSGLGVGGVTMMLSGSVSANTTTNTSGNYTFRGLSNGTYIVEPSLSGYTFTPSSTQVIISEADVTGVNFVATVVVVEGCSTWADVITKYDAYVNGEATWAEVIGCYQEYSSTYSISGTVTGDIPAGVTLTLSGSVSATTVTDASGNYRFRGLSNGTYTVAPTKTGFTFTPSSTQVQISGADVTGVDFTAFAVGAHCSTMSEVITKYEAYIRGEATWADFLICYQEYLTH